MFAPVEVVVVGVVAVGWVVAGTEVVRVDVVVGRSSVEVEEVLVIRRASGGAEEGGVCVSPLGISSALSRKIAFRRTAIEGSRCIKLAANSG